MDLKFSKIVSKELKKAEMMLYGLIGEEVNGSYFAQELAWLGKNYDEITIRVNSDGGVVSDGLGILAMMMASSARIIVHIDGIAASMAAVVVAGADEVIMNDFALLMIHSPYYQDDNGDKVNNPGEKAKSVLKNLTNSLVQLLTKRGIAEDEVLNMMKKDSWFNAEQALTAKLVDKIVVTGRKLELAAIEPKRLVAMINKEHTNNLDIEMKKVISLLKLPETSDETAVVAAIEKLQTGGSQVGLVVDKLLKVGESLGVITDKNKVAMKKLADTDLGLFLDLFQVNDKPAENKPEVDAQVSVRLTEVIAALKTGTGAPATRSDADRFGEEEKKGPAALAAWKAKDAADYGKCYKAYWGEDAK